MKKTNIVIASTVLAVVILITLLLFGAKRADFGLTDDRERLPQIDKVEKIEVLQEGEGEEVLWEDGMRATVNIWAFGEGGEELDYQHEFAFVFGDGTLHEILQMGISRMRVGEKRRFTMEDIVFEIELVSIEARSVN